MSEVKSSSQLFRNFYIRLYKELRKYLWDFDTVNLIADIELSAYKSFPDVAQLKLLLGRLRQNLFETLREDDELRKSLEDFEESVNDNQEVVLFIKRPKEVEL